MRTGGSGPTGDTASRGAAARRVGVNLLWLVPGVVGGSEEYLTRLLGGLAEQPVDDLDLTLFVLRPFAAAHPHLVEQYPTCVLPTSGRSKLVRVAAESSWLAERARGLHLDLVHHAGGVVPPVRTVASVVTIHDLQPLVFPSHFHPVKRSYLSVMLPRAARAARLVLTPSDYVRHAVVERLGVPGYRVMTVPHGVAPVDTQAQAGQAPVPDGVRRRYGIDGPYLLYPAITYPHKNHVMLVQAFARLATTHPQARLVLTHRAAEGEGAVLAEVERLGLQRRVLRLGLVPRAHLDALIDGARALVFPSRFEGFGAPALEAMSRGCPVIAADATALPEVVGKAGWLVDPDDVDAWVWAMTAVLEDDRRWRSMRAAGLARAATFTWHRAADALTFAYRRALSVSPGSGKGVRR